MSLLKCYFVLTASVHFLRLFVRDAFLIVSAALASLIPSPLNMFTSSSLSAMIFICTGYKLQETGVWLYTCKIRNFNKLQIRNYN